MLKCYCKQIQFGTVDFFISGMQYALRIIAARPFTLFFMVNSEFPAICHLLLGCFLQRFLAMKWMETKSRRVGEVWVRWLVDVAGPQRRLSLLLPRHQARRGGIIHELRRNEIELMTEEWNRYLNVDWKTTNQMDGHAQRRGSNVQVRHQRTKKLMSRSSAPSYRWEMQAFSLRHTMQGDIGLIDNLDAETCNTRDTSTAHNRKHKMLKWL